MPELPEVETVCRGLCDTIVGRRIVHAEHFRPNLRIAFPPEFSARLAGREVTAVERRAKYIVITLDDGLVILAHLGMSGKMIVYPHLQNSRKTHDHAVFQFDGGMEMVFNDPRRFGLITFCDGDIAHHPLIVSLGLEPLESEFDGAALYAILKKKTSPIKLSIMDASQVVGVGNIYACEALFRTRILPTRPSSTLSQKECDALAKNIKQVLEEAIISGGSTLRDYVRSSGDAGYFQHHFSVYGREGKACIVCENAIKRVKQAGRSTFYCSDCQK